MLIIYLDNPITIGNVVTVSDSHLRQYVGTTLIAINLHVPTYGIPTAVAEVDTALYLDKPIETLALLKLMIAAQLSSYIVEQHRNSNGFTH